MMRLDPRLMRGALLLAGACLAFYGSTIHAAPIKGKFGLGVDTGELLSSSAEGALILGKSDRRAWLWVITANGSANSGSQLIDYYYPDTLFTRDVDNSGFSFGV